jgi:hypothetical protein
MTPKEKARELVNQYRIILMNEDTECGNEILCTEIAKQCALIAVDEMIGEYQSMSDLESILVINNKPTFVVHQLVYWQEVKQEINLI